MNSSATEIQKKAQSTSEVGTAREGNAKYGLPLRIGARPLQGELGVGTGNRSGQDRRQCMRAGRGTAREVPHMRERVDGRV